MSTCVRIWEYEHVSVWVSKRKKDEKDQEVCSLILVEFRKKKKKKKKKKDLLFIHLIRSPRIILLL